MTATATTLRANYTPLGNLCDFFYDVRDPEILVEGAAGTGKTYCILQLIHGICLKHPGVRILVIRKTLKSLTDTAVVTYRQKVLAPGEEGTTVEWYGGSGAEPASFRYKNGSRIVLGGMDKSDKILGSEYDLIYVNEAVEISQQQWERLTTRLRNTVLPPDRRRIIGDCNPSFAHHWLNKRCMDGLTRRVTTSHADNPTVTPEYLATLERLSGSQRERFLLGQWAGIENAVYPTLDPSIHLQPLPEDVHWGTGAIGVDYGEVHFSAVVAIQRASDGVYWVRRCWAETGGNPQLIEDAARGMKVQYGITRVRTDPLQKVLAYRLGGKTAEMHREQRISYTRRLVESNNLLFDIDGEGVRDLFDEMLGYRYEFKETDTMAKNQLVRKQDDRVAALEDAIEELEIENGGLTYTLPVPQIRRDPVTYQPYIREHQPPLVRAFRSF